MQWKNVVPGVLGAAALAAAVVAAPNSVNSASIQDGQVKTADIGTGQVWQSQMAGPVNDVYLKTYNNTVGDPQLKQDVRARLAIGELVATAEIPTTTIQYIGGKFTERATNAGKITLPAGRMYRVDSQYKFDRLTAGTAGDPAVRPQIALRYANGGDAGTSMGVEISKTKGRELVGTTVGFLDLTAATGPTDVTVYFFGYTDTGDDTDSGKLTGEARVAATVVK